MFGQGLVDKEENGVDKTGLPACSNHSLIKGETKPAKIQELVKNIPNSISNNKDHLELLSISKLKVRNNPQSLLTGKIFARISNYDDIPLYINTSFSSYLAIDNEGHFFNLSLYNTDAVKVDEKLKKDALISVLNPEAKVVQF